MTVDCCQCSAHLLSLTEFSFEQKPMITSVEGMNGLLFILVRDSLWNGQSVRVKPLTQHEAELDGLLFDMGVRLCDVGAAAAEGVRQNGGHFHTVVH